MKRPQRLKILKIPVLVLLVALLVLFGFSVADRVMETFKPR